MLKDFPAKKIV